MNEGIFHKKDQPLIIAGPCSAETEKQVLETAQRLLKMGKVDILRAGIWKPRTSPGSFEGVGAKGLPWLKEAKIQTGIPLTVEVANAKHCLLYTSPSPRDQRGSRMPSSA